MDLDIFGDVALFRDNMDRYILSRAAASGIPILDVTFSGRCFEPSVTCSRECPAERLLQLRVPRESELPRGRRAEYDDHARRDVGLVLSLLARRLCAGHTERQLHAG